MLVPKEQNRRFAAAPSRTPSPDRSRTGFNATRPAPRHFCICMDSSFLVGPLTCFCCHSKSKYWILVSQCPGSPLPRPCIALNGSSNYLSFISNHVSTCPAGTYEIGLSLLFILPSKASHYPVTTSFAMEKESHSDRNIEVVESGGLHPALSRDGQHLNPQPSNDPADPLNWPMALKVCIHLQITN